MMTCNNAAGRRSPIAILKLQGGAVCLPEKRSVQFFQAQGPHE